MICRRILIPDDEEYIAIFNGALVGLTRSWNYEQSSGGATPDEVAGLFSDLFERARSGQCMRIGAIFMWVSATIPADCLICDGTQYLRADYPDLYAALPTTYHVDADNFVTPAMATRVPRQTGNQANLGIVSGSDTVTIATANLPAHSHAEITATPVVIAVGAGVPAPAAIPGVGVTGNAGGGTALSVTPRFMLVNFLIQAK
jgi:microcystin-dependent protein